jgi:hypothetical protein
VLVLGQLLDMRRSDGFKQLTNVALQQRIVEVNELYQKMSDLVAQCPEELLFDTSQTTPYDPMGALCNSQI